MREGALRIEELLGKLCCQIASRGPNAVTQDNKERGYDRRSPISVRDKPQI